MNQGKKFEQEIRDSVPDYMWYYRIPDTSNSFSGGMGSRFTNQSRYDCLMWNMTNGHLFGFELKSTQSNSIPFADREIPETYERMKKEIKEYKDNCPFNLTVHQEQVLERMNTNLKKQKKKLSVPSIKYHQIHNLEEDSKSGLVCGFMFQFRESNIAYFLNINDFLKFWLTTPKKSINEKDIIEYGGVQLKFSQKKTKHHYDLDNLIQTIEKENK